MKEKIYIFESVNFFPRKKKKKKKKKKIAIVESKLDNRFAVTPLVKTLHKIHFNNWVLDPR